MNYNKIEQCLEAGDYELAMSEILKLQNLKIKDEQLDFFLAKAKFLTNDFEVAKIILEALLNEGSKLYFEVLFMLCQSNIALGNYDEAAKLLEEELSQSYIPLKWEEKYKKLYKEVVIKNKAESNRKMLSDDKLEEHLFAKDELENFIAVDYIKNSNARMHLDTIKDFLSNEENSYKIKSILFEILIEQGINEELAIAKFGETHVANPKNFVPNEQTKVLREIEDLAFELANNASLANFAKELYVHYYVHYFPVIENSTSLYRAIIYVAALMVNEEIELSLTKEDKQKLKIIEAVKF